MIGYEKTQETLLKVIDGLRPELDSHELALLSGQIAKPWSTNSEALKASYMAEAVLAVANATARVWNTRGYKLGLERGMQLVATKPPIVQLIDAR